jgi:hypothetical protein
MDFDGYSSHYLLSYLEKEEKPRVWCGVKAEIPV